MPATPIVNCSARKLCSFSFLLKRILATDAFSLLLFFLVPVFSLFGHSDCRDRICGFRAGVSNLNDLGATGQVALSQGKAELKI